MALVLPPGLGPDPTLAAITDILRLTSKDIRILF
jgi:hypothetical protein